MRRCTIWFDYLSDSRGLLHRRPVRRPWVSDELTEDAPYLVRYIADELRASVTVAENDLIVASWTTSGILTDPATGAELLLDAFADQIAAQTACTGYVPSAVVVVPAVLSTLRKARRTSNDAYTIDPVVSGARNRALRAVDRDRLDPGEHRVGRRWRRCGDVPARPDRCLGWSLRRRSAVRQHIS